jgi:hypothetical protein
VTALAHTLVEVVVVVLGGCGEGDCEQQR